MKNAFDPHSVTSLRPPLAPPPDQTPPELPGDLARQAVPALRGYVYQAWCSIDAWLQLRSEDEVIYLEGAEDVDRVGRTEAIAEQVRHVAEPLSLNSQKTCDALEHFWSLKLRESRRTVIYHYLTTASIAMERDSDFEEMRGIDAWRAAQTNVQLAETIRKYLLTKLAAGTPLHSFTASAVATDFQSEVVRRFHFFTDQPGIEDVKQSIDDHLTHRLAALNVPLSLVGRVRNQLESTFWNVVVRPSSSDRRLTLAELNRQIDSASTDYVPVPAGQFQQLLQALPALLNAASAPGRSLLEVMRLPIPGVPSPLLERGELVAKVRQHVEGRRTVLLTGTVYKGKTTLAQLVATELCPQAWWFPLSERAPIEADNLLRALAQAVESDVGPQLVVIDDIDLAPNSHAVYRHSLALLVHRASMAGRGLLLTARGASSDAETLADFSGIEIVNVPEMNTDEIERHCVSYGCDKDVAPAWALFIYGATRGHPKLVQVRIAELAADRWPSVSPAQLIGQSPALETARHFARRLLSDRAPPQVVEFVYTAAEATTPLSRAVLLALGGSVEGLDNEGDVIDSLRGKWLEPVEEDRLRVTPMLQGSAAEAWPKAKRDRAHQCIYDAIASVRTLRPSDAAALLYHAFVAQDSARLIHAVGVLHGIKNKQAITQTYHYLVWLPFVALERNQRFVDSDPVASLFLRQLQFDVAKELDSSSLPVVLDRWSDEIATTAIPELRSATQSYQWLALVGSQSKKIPLRRQLDAISSIDEDTGSLADVAAKGTRVAIAMSHESPGGVPLDATPTEFYLSMRAVSIKCSEDIATLLQWLEEGTTDKVRRAFESVLQWPLVHATGAYLHGAWAAGCEERKDWSPWITLLQRADAVAKRLGLRNYGREVAKAKSIILGEYLNDHASALRVLDEATQDFGSSLTLLEQRTNALFQAGRDEEMLKAWNDLLPNGEVVKALDPFAFRRAGISAGRLKRWQEAEDIFVRGSETSRELQLTTTKIGMLCDASYAAALGDAPQRAARRLSDAMLELPPVAFEDDHPDWEALLRTASEYRRYIDGTVNASPQREKRVELGHASMAGLKASEPQPNQLMRAQLTVAQAGELAARLGSISPDYKSKLTELADANFPMVRMVATLGLLAIEFLRGPGSSSFPRRLSAYEEAFACIASLPDRKQGFEDDSAGRQPVHVRTVPDEWFPVFVAAACCCENIPDCLDAWAKEVRSVWPNANALKRNLEEMALGYALPRTDALSAVTTSRASTGMRCGAALHLLTDLETPPRTMFGIQSLLSSALVSNAQGVLLKDCFAGAVARRFARPWDRFADNPFQLLSPRTSVPALKSMVLDVREGRARLRTLLESAAPAVGMTVGEFVERLP